MKKLIDLKVLFTVVAILELIYALIGTLTPPSMMQSVTGWVLTPDGHWATKLISMALASQAWVAWTLRKEPHLGVAKALAFYQIASSLVDVIMWITMADDGIFSTTAGKISVIASIPTHFSIGILLVIGILKKAGHKKNLESA
jgi:hypothetical protein